MGKLIFVALPIGNLEDITLRALRVLKETDLILAEKPIKTLKLLSHFKIRKSIYPYFEGKNERNLNKVLQAIQEGKNIVFVSEAGTPGIADPGQKLVNWAIENKIEVEFIPGASALSFIISASGFSSKMIEFFGFLPKKGRTKISEIIKNDLAQKKAVVFFHSPYRLIRDLEFLNSLDEKPDCRQAGLEIVLVKEVTKMHEKIFRGPLPKILEDLKKETIKGEWTGIIRKIL